MPSLARREAELANRELTCSLAEAALRFIKSTGGLHADGLKVAIDEPLAVFRQDMRRAFAVRDFREVV